MIRAQSLRTQRIARRVSRGRGRNGLNLVSLMDIFTILVFFLLVNSSQVEVLPNPKTLTLPDSVSSQRPQETLLLMVTQTEILVNGEPVMPLHEARDVEGNVLAALRSRLITHPLQPLEGGAPGALTRGEINIMADKSTPYQLVKKVMATCTEARFAKISLAVIHKQGEGA